MDMLFASANAHKKEELERMLANRHSLILPKELGIDFDFEETGETFSENALGKAMALYLAGDGRPVLADDSGLVVPALGNAPGVRTARYGSEVFGRMLQSQERNLYLLKNMEHLTDEGRQASFVCAIALVLSPQRVFIFQEEVKGHITTQEAGCGGFGYDPVFFIDEAGATMAELEGPMKDHYSHRGRAVRHLMNLLETLD